MKPLPILVVLAVALGAPLVAGLPGGPHVHADARASPAPRGSILIDGDAAFAMPGSGVISGQGTATDPYVIAGWTLLHSDRDALRLNGTRAHVVLRDLVVPGVDRLAPRLVECQAGACPDAGGVSLLDAENVTLENVTILEEPFALRVAGGGGIAIRNVRIGSESIGSALGGYGIHLSGTRDVLMEDVGIASAYAPMVLTDVRNVAIERATIVSPEGGAGTIPLRDAHDVRFAQTVFRGVELVALTRLDNLTLAGDVFDGGAAALDFFGSAPLHGLVICGSEIRNMTSIGLGIVAAHDAWIAGNRIHGNAVALSVGGGSNVTVERNDVTGSAGDGMTFAAGGSVVRNNSFAGNGGAHYVGGVGIDLRHNWWGDASGPSGDGPGSGDALFLDPGTTAPFSPWLSSPPDLEVDCGTVGAPGASEDPATTAVKMGAKAHVRVGQRSLKALVQADLGRHALL